LSFLFFPPHVWFLLKDEEWGDKKTKTIFGLSACVFLVSGRDCFFFVAHFVTPSHIFVCLFWGWRDWGGKHTHTPDERGNIEKQILYLSFWTCTTFLGLYIIICLFRFLEIFFFAGQQLIIFHFSHIATHTHTQRKKSFFFHFPLYSFLICLQSINFIFPDYNSLLKKNDLHVSVILISFNTHHFVYFLLPWINFFLWTVFVCLDIFKNYLSSIFSFPTSEFTRMYVVPVYVCACFSLLFFLFKETISDLKKILYLSYSLAIQIRKKSCQFLSSPFLI
jgi:hypothetical protein